MHVTGRDLLSADQVPGTFWVRQFALLVLTLPGAPGRGTAQQAGRREGPWAQPQGRPAGRGDSLMSRRGVSPTGTPEGAAGAGTQCGRGRGHEAPGREAGPQSASSGRPLGLAGRWGREMRAVSVRICLSMCVCTCILTCVRVICVCPCMCICMSVCLCVCLHACMCACICVYVCGMLVYMTVYVRGMHVYVYACMFVYVCVFTYVHVCMYRSVHVCDMLVYLNVYTCA